MGLRLSYEPEATGYRGSEVVFAGATLRCATCAVPHAQVVDISGNQSVTNRGATAINRMLCRNRRITICRFHGTVPASLKGPLMVQLEANFHSSAVAREDYYTLKAAFEEMDHNKDGTADLKVCLGHGNADGVVVVVGGWGACPRAPRGRWSNWASSAWQRGEAGGGRPERGAGVGSKNCATTPAPTSTTPSVPATGPHQRSNDTTRGHRLQQPTERSGPTQHAK